MTTGRRAVLLAALCLASAAACRFALFDLVEFKYDEAQVATYALELVRHHIIPQTSIRTSGGFQNPPLMVYLAAIPMLLSTSPLVITGFFSALNALAVGGLYLAGRRLFGDVAALVAALLYAVGPLAVHYSRKIWAPDAMPPFTVLLFAGLALGLGDGQGWWLAAALVALAVLVQLHQAAIVLLPVTLLLLAMFAPRLPWRRRSCWGGLLAGLTGFVVLLLPYTVYELQHQLADIQGMANQVGAYPSFTFLPWRDLWWLTAGWNPQLFFSTLAAQEQPPLAGSSLTDWAVLALGLVGIGACLLALGRSDPVRPGNQPSDAGGRRVAAATLLLLTLAPPVVVMRSATPVYPHYLVFLLPLLFLLVGIGVNVLVQLLRAARAPTWLSSGAPAAVTAALVFASLLRLVAFDQLLTVHTTGGDYGTPLRYSLLAAQALHGNAPAGGDQRAFVMATEGDVLAVYRYLVATGIAPAATLVQPDQVLPLPTAAGSTYLFTGTSSPAFAALLAGGATGQPLPTVAPAYTVVHLTPQQLQGDARQFVPAVRPVGPFQIGSGLALTSAQTTLAGPAGPLSVMLVWSVTDPARFARQPVKIFVHLYDTGRNTIAQEDAAGDPASAWQRGDRLLTWFAPRLHVSLPPGRYTLVAGVYIVAGFHVFPVQGPRGEDLGGEIPLGELIVRSQ